MVSDEDRDPGGLAEKRLHLEKKGIHSKNNLLQQNECIQGLKD
jgi:hypothetical protein